MPETAHTPAEHGFGSRNWDDHNRPGDGLGEVVDVIPEWYDGHQPEGACPEPFPTDCRLLTLFDPVFATIHLSGTATTIVLHQLPGQNFWQGAWDRSIGNCGNWEVTVRCEQDFNQPDGRHRWHVVVSANNPIAQFSTGAFFDLPGQGQDFEWTVPLADTVSNFCEALDPNARVVVSSTGGVP